MTRLRAFVLALFGSPVNAALTVLVLAFLAWALPPLWHWAFAAATWDAPNRRGCAPDGACWAFVRARLGLFFYGSFPVDQRWRADLAGVLLVGSLAGAVLTRRRRGVWLALALGAVPVISAVLLAGGLPGLPSVPTVYWGGLMLNFVLAFVAVAAAIPLGTLLALGRRSRWPFVHGLCLTLIEFWRGVPLLAVLFMGLVLLPMALPAGVSLDNLVRVLVVLTLFESAYMAEVVRGGLQGVDRGQREAASALGLHPLQVNLTVVLPQAFRVALPGIVNLAVDLFKDTTLVSIVGLFDLMGIVNQSLKDQAWLGFPREGYVFAAVLFFVCCLLISLAGSLIERRISKQSSI
jgi:general L-amino acid transport system permease protein